MSEPGGIKTASFAMSLREIREGITAAARSALEGAVTATVKAVNKTPHYKDRTGNLRASTRKIRKGAWHYQVTSGNEKAYYALWIEAGTRRHWIEPVHANFLSWTGADGVRRFSTGHYVSGITARRYMQSARDWGEMTFRTTFVPKLLVALKKRSHGT